MSDGALLIDVDARLECLVSPWVALEPALPPIGVQPAARLYLHEAPLLGVEVPRTTPALRVGSVGVWLRPDSSGAVLGAVERDCAGAVDLDVLQATVVTSVTSGVARRLHAMLTLAVALLLGRLGRAVVSAGAVVAPDGGAWLAAGDEGTGTANTVRRLVASGWSCLSVERALLRQEAGHGGVVVEGWPETPAAASADELAPRPSSASLAGVLLVRQTPQEETVLIPRAKGDLLAALSPTSPWLRLDQTGAAGILRALRSGLAVPVYDLHLGLDSYASPWRLAETLAGLPASS